MHTRVTSPPGPLFSLQTLREHVRVDAVGDSHPDDGLLLRNAAAARAFAENYTGMAIGEQTREIVADGFWDLTSNSFPGGTPDAVSAFEYRSVGTPNWTPLSAALFYYDEYAGVVRFWPDAALPGLPDIHNAARIRYTIGAEVPVDVRAAILLIVGELYLNRELSAQADLRHVPLGARELLAPHRLELGV